MKKINRRTFLSSSALTAAGISMAGFSGLQKLTATKNKQGEGKTNRNQSIGEIKKVFARYFSTEQRIFYLIAIPFNYIVFMWSNYFFP